VLTFMASELSVYLLYPVVNLVLRLVERPEVFFSGDVHLDFISLSTTKKHLYSSPIW
jgi:hypothetical protein